MNLTLNDGSITAQFHTFLSAFPSVRRPTYRPLHIYTVPVATALPCGPTQPYLNYTDDSNEATFMAHVTTRPASLTCILNVKRNTNQALGQSSDI